MTYLAAELLLPWYYIVTYLTINQSIILFFIPSDSVTHLCFGMDEEGEAVQQRYGLIKEFGLVLAGPLVASSPLRSLIADILCSMPKVFIDLSYTICVYSSTNLHDGAEQCVQGTLANSSSVRYWYLTLLMSLIPYSNSSSANSFPRLGTLSCKLLR